jgi:hypothetical protein
MRLEAYRTQGDCGFRIADLRARSQEPGERSKISDCGLRKAEGMEHRAEGKETGVRIQNTGGKDKN